MRLEITIWINQNPHYIVINMIYNHISDLVVSKQKIFIWPHSILLFLDYLPFSREHDPSSNDNIWLKLVQWFLRRFLKCSLIGVHFPQEKFS
jgi:hypothetical protein